MRKQMKMGKNKLKLYTQFVTCDKCIARPAFLHQKDLDSHRVNFHGEPSFAPETADSFRDTPSPGIVQGIRKTAKRISELIGSKQKLKSQLKETKAEVARLDNLAGTQENTVRLLKEEVKNLERKYIAKNLEIDKLKQHKEELWPESEALKETKKSKAGKVKLVITSKVNDFRKTVDAEYLSLMDSMKKVTGEVEYDASSKINSARDIREQELIRMSHDYQKAQMGTMKNQIETLNREVTDLKHLREFQETRLTKEQTRQRDIDQSHKDALRILQDKTKQVEDCQLEITTLNEQLREQSLVIENLTKESTKYQEKYRVFKQKTIDNQHKIALLHAQVSQLTSVNATVKESMQELRISVAAAKNKIEEREISLQELSQSEKVLLLKIKRLSMELEEKEMKHKTNSLKVESYRLELKGKIEELECQNENSAETNQVLRGQLRETSSREDGLSRQIKSLQEDKAAVTRERNNLKRQIEQVKRQVDEAQLKMQNIQEANVEMTKSNNKMQTEKVNLKREMRALKENIDKLKRKQQAGNPDLNERANVIVELETRKEKIQGIRRDLEDATKCHEREQKKMQEEIATLQREIAARDTKMKRATEESRNIQDGLLKLIDDLRQRCDQETGTTKVNNNNNNNNNNVCDTIITSGASKEIEDTLRENLTEMKQAANAQEERFEKLKALHQKLDGEFIRVSNVNNNLEEKYQELQDKFNRLQALSESHYKKLIDTASELEIARKSSEELANKMAEKERASNQRIKELENTIEDLNAKYKDAETKAQIEHDSCADLKRRLNESESSLSRLDQQLQSEISRHATGQTAQAKVTSLNAELVKVKEDNIKLKTEIQRHDTENKALKKQIITKSSKEVDELSNTKIQLLKCEKEKGVIAKKLNESQTAQETLSAKLQQMTQSLESAEQVKKDLEMTENDMENVKMELNKSVERQQILENKLKVELDNHDKASNQKIEDLREQLDECEHDKHQFKVELEESLAMQRALQIRLDECDSDRSISDEAEELRRQLKECEKEKQQQKIELEKSLNVESNKLKQEMYECRQANEKLNRQLNESQSIRASLEQRLNERANCDGSCSVAEELKKEAESAHEELEKSKRFSEFQKEYRDSDSKEIKQLKTDLEEVRKKLRNANADLAEKKKESKSVVASKDDLQRAKSEAEMLRRDLADVKFRLKTLEGVEQQLKDCKEEIESLKEDKSNSSNNSNEESEQKETAAVKATEQTTKLQDEICSLKQELKETKEQLRVKSTSAAALAKERSQADTLSQRLRDEKKVLESTLHDTELKLKKECDMRDTAVSELDRGNARVRELRRENTDMMATVKKMRAENQEAVNELEDEITNVQKQYAELQAKQNNKVGGGMTNDEAQRLKNKCDALAKENEELKKKLEELEKQQKSNKTTKINNNDAKAKESINWGVAYRSYNSSLPSLQRASDEIPAATPDKDLHADSSGDSLNLCVPSKMSHFTVHGGKNTRDGKVSGKIVNSEEDSDDLDLALANPELTAHINNFTMDDFRSDAEDENDGDNLYGDEYEVHPFQQPVRHVHPLAHLHALNQQRSGGMMAGHANNNNKSSNFDTEPSINYKSGDLQQKLKTVGDNSTNEKKKKKKKKNKEPKAEKKLNTLAPLSGPLPPPVVRSIGIVNKPLGAIPSGPKPQKSTPLKGIMADKFPPLMHNMPLHHNPLDAKPLPALKNAPNPEQIAFLNKYSPAPIKHFGPAHPMPGPGPEYRIHQPQDHYGGAGHVHFADYYDNEEYINHQEDVNKLVADLNRTNAQLAQLDAMDAMDAMDCIKQQFYH